MATPFRRRDSSFYSIPQEFADNQIPFCPVCGTKEPEWLTAEDHRILFKYYYFKCAKCGGTLETTEEDVIGLAKTTKTFYGKYKKYKGKEAGAIYVRINRLPSGTTDLDIIGLQGKELVLDDLLVISGAVWDRKKKEDNSDGL